MPSTESARSVPNGRHTHGFTIVPADVSGLTTTNFATTVYGLTTTSIDPDDATAAGTATTVSRSDHQHQITCASAVALIQTLSSSEGNNASFARSDHVHSTEALPWGLVAEPFNSDVDSGPHSATTTTDMALDNVAVTADHWYEIRLLSQLSLSGTGVWTLDLLVNGVAYDRLWRIDQTTPVMTAEGATLWQAPATQSTDDFAVRATEASGTATLTLVGSSAAMRWLSIRDLGVPS